MHLNSFMSVLVSGVDFLDWVLTEIEYLRGITTGRVIVEVYCIEISQLLAVIFLLYKRSFKKRTEVWILLPQLTQSEYVPSPLEYIHLLVQPPKTIEKHPVAFTLGYVDGTFDHLHCGHLFLLTVAGTSVFKLTIGFCTNALVQHKPHSNLIQPLEFRVKNVLNFLKALNKNLDVEVVYLTDSVTFLGNANHEVVFASTEPGHPFEEIIQIRMQKSGPPLQRVVVDLVDYELGKISSSHVRNEMHQGSHDFM